MSNSAAAPREVSQRFVIERQAGSGGMGTVYKAQDRQTGLPVALKLLRAGNSAKDIARFHREAQVLSELRHPGIVAYVAHGFTEDETPYLAMEWLDGHELSRRLSEGPLPLGDALRILEQVATALVVAHERGVVHRDLKPSNLFLREGRIDQLLVLDFGIARQTLGSAPITQTGVIVGTIDYMSPEQARGESKIGPAADIFALGCVAYECLVGQPPFSGAHAAAVLSKILFEEPTPLSTQQVPEAVSALIANMLAKDPAQRPRDARALIERLQSLPALDERKASVALPRARPRVTALTEKEQQLVSVIMARRAADSGAAEATVGWEEAGRLQQEQGLLADVLEQFGIKCERLIDGSIVAALGQGGAAFDHLTQGARAALELSEMLPETVVVLATGRGLLNQSLPVGEAIDRAAQLLKEACAMERRGAVWLDGISAGLLDTRFATDRESARGSDLERCLLRGERQSADDNRLLLGRPTPCVGREHDLSLLESTVAACIDEGGARSLVVSGAPGSGKSRLRHEFLRRLASRGAKVKLFCAAGTTALTSLPWGLMGQALRSGFELRDSDPLAVRQERLRQCISSAAPAAEAQRLTVFLGELCGAPFSSDASAALRAARQDPRLMHDQVRQAVIAWLRIECADKCCIFVLDDLHWSDASTIQLVENVLDALAEQPLAVLGFGRPELHEQFPRLNKAWRAYALVLAGLSRGASERLIKHVLGDKAAPAIVDRIIKQAAGNALYLEELMRAVADGKGEALPETVLAMLQARISRLDGAARRVLRAASVFGESFFSGGVLAMLGKGRVTLDLDVVLRHLVEDEVIEPHRASRLPGESEYAFRHALLRDAAYDMLTEHDRTLGHRLAGEYLEEMTRSVTEPHGPLLRSHRGDWVFDIVHHLNRARSLFVEPMERLHLARLNGDAGRRAKSTSGYDAALDYLRLARQLLPEDAWELDDALTFEILREHAECEFLCGAIESAEAEFTGLQARARSDMERAQLLGLRMHLYTASGRFDDAVAAGRQGLSLLGIEIPDEEGARQALIGAEIGAISAYLAEHSIASLASAPTMDDPVKRAALHILHILGQPAYFVSPTLFAFTVVKMVSLSIAHGNGEVSASGYSMYSVFLAGVLGNYPAAYEFGELALAVNERFDVAELKTKLQHIFGACGNQSRRHLREGLPYLSRAVEAFADSGDLVYTAYAALFRAVHTFELGRPFDEVTAEIERSLQIVTRAKERVTHSILLLLRQLVKNLRDRTRDARTLDDDSFQEEAHLQEIEAAGLGAAICFYHTARLQLDYMRGDAAAAALHIEPAERTSAACVGMFYTTELRFYASLALSALYSSQDEAARARTRDKQEALLRGFSAMADSAPANYQHKHLLMQAEWLRAQGKREDALLHHERAAQLAAEQGFTQDAALSQSLRGRLLQEMGERDRAAVALSAARAGYLRWGATALGKE